MDQRDLKLSVSSLSYRNNQNFNRLEDRVKVIEDLTGPDGNGGLNRAQLGHVNRIVQQQAEIAVARSKEYTDCAVRPIKQKVDDLSIQVSALKTSVDEVKLRVDNIEQFQA